ncbi:MAG: hypothetical protein V7688_11085 [Alcanivorax jadensis]|uniref:TRAFAC clade GTPase domain-containing protein n=1 Tax=Alcanivorax jadensis TaxID=64988 RepID=UPI003002B9BB
MNERSVVIIGLPESGKTTFLAALWHIVTSRELGETALQFGGLDIGDVSHLNDIARRWREAKIQDRTSVTGIRVVKMRLKAPDGRVVSTAFPDAPGESYRQMWEVRECTREVASMLQQGAVMLFVHADAISRPLWVADEVQLNEELGIANDGEEPEPWTPELAPTQVQLVDLLQLLRREPLDSGPRRLAIMLSAWDKVSGESLSPEEFLRSNLPLLWQYLRLGGDSWEFEVYGVSAQGGEYDSNDRGGVTSPEAEHLRSLDSPSKRIRLVRQDEESHDLTEPLKWLME